MNKCRHLEEIKTSEKIYNINRQLSLKCVAMRQPLTLEELEQLNLELAYIIKEVRELELVYLEKDVKKAELEYKQWLNDNVEYVERDRLWNKFIKIFGDFEK